MFGGVLSLCSSSLLTLSLHFSIVVSAARLLRLFVVDHSHGFAWEAGSDVNTHILPLYHYVRNVNHTETGGYYGK